MKKLLALVWLCSACGAPDALDGSENVQGEPELGTLEQGIMVQSAYGVQLGPGGSPQKRCLSSDPVECMVPAKKTVEVVVDFGGGIAAADRTTIAAALNAALTIAKAGDDGFNWQAFSRTGFPPAGENACSLQVQSTSFTPVTPFANDMRRYLGGYGYGTIADFGTHSTFRTLVVQGNWLGLKAHRGVTGACTTDTFNPCFVTAKKMILAFMAACAGVGLTSNSSADGRGNDIEANSAVSFLAADGDLCRMKMYDPSVPGFVPEFPHCSL